MQGVVEPGAAITAQFKLEVPGVPTLAVAKVGAVGLEQVLAEMHDRSMQPTGIVKSGETDMEHAAHHASERVAMFAWWNGVRSGAADAKRDVTLHFLGADQQPRMTLLLQGAMLKKFEASELDSKSDGEEVMLKWTLAYDDCYPI